MKQLHKLSRIKCGLDITEINGIYVSQNAIRKFDFDERKTQQK